MARKKVVSIRLSDEEAAYLARTARRLGRTPSATAAMLVDEGLRRERFPQIEMRDTAAGRIAYLKGHRLPVWMMVSRMRAGKTPEQVAEDLEVPESLMHEALAYGEVFREEIDTLIDESKRFWEDPEKHLRELGIQPPDAPPAR
jgi:uncharacterized protein (DUF433 family)